jgi:predicted thioesterase
MTVTESDLAIAFRSGDVPVLATPRVVALLEEATLAALDGVLEAGQTSVGMRINLDHLAPSCSGSEVVAQAQLNQVDGRRLTFSVEARGVEGGTPLLASATIVRVVVDTVAFLGRINPPTDTLSE